MWPKRVIIVVAHLIQIPGWLKQELANSEATDGGNEPDDTTSGHSDEDIIPEASMSSIRINRNLQHGG